MKWLLLLIIPIVLIFGCGKQGLEGVDQDRAALESLIESSAYLTTDEHYGNEEAEDTKDDILPIFWWRGRPAKIEREIYITIVDDSAFVEINTTIYDTLFIQAIDSFGDTTITLYKKPYIDYGKRFAIFKKDTLPSYFRGWRLYALSGIEVISDTNTVDIDSIQIEWNGNIEMITDPLELQNRDEVLTFSSNEELIITVYTNDVPAFVFLHTPKYGHPHRWRLQYGNGTYHGWCLCARNGVHHIAIDMIARPTLLDSEYPYDSNAWILPYRVE
ncbi:hypothetical protein KAX35_00320 [candidate division WOR-3 bacterium]|nr:hypothetical protein [candidate division WOR-3 bacterium]